jgi:hypothetical protein
MVLVSMRSGTDLVVDKDAFSPRESGRLVSRRLAARRPTVQKLPPSQPKGLTTRNNRGEWMLLVTTITIAKTIEASGLTDSATIPIMMLAS